MASAIEALLLAVVEELLDSEVGTEGAAAGEEGEASSEGAGSGETAGLFLAEEGVGDDGLVVFSGDGAAMVEEGAIGGEGILAGGGGKELFEGDEEVGFWVGPAPVGGAHAIGFGALEAAGADGIEFGVEEGVLDGLEAEEPGIFEAVGPEGAAAMEAAIEPFGELAVDMVHEAGEVEEVVVELFPVGGGPVLGEELPAGAEAEAGALLEFVAGEAAEGLEEEDGVEVVPHELEGGEVAGVEAEVACEDLEELAGDAAAAEGEEGGVAGDMVVEVIERGFGGFESRRTGHGLISGSAVLVSRSSDNRLFIEPKRRKSEICEKSIPCPPNTNPSPHGWNTNLSPRVVPSGGETNSKGNVVEKRPLF